MENFKTIFSESYQSVYCRAKSILDKEEDVISLVKEVYLLAGESSVADVDAKSWMVKQAYILGCGKYRKKKAREAEIIELCESDYAVHKGIDVDKTKELIRETLAELPDLYHATLFAFYFDQYSIKEIASITGYNEGVVINRLNYIHKYLSKKLEDYQEENKVKVQFSVEMVFEALKQWATENTMDEMVAQNLYTNLCKEQSLPIESLEIQSAVSDALLENDADAVKEQLLAYSVKKGPDQKKVVLVAAIICGLAVLALVAILVFGNRGPQDESKGHEQEMQDDIQEEQVVEEEAQEEDAQEEEVPEEDAKDEDVLDNGYLLPDSNSRKLTRADLQGLSKEELRLARNEIFARHGMIFDVADLDAYFATKSWYRPSVAYDEYYDKVEMNSYEEANLVLISQVEEELQ